MTQQYGITDKIKFTVVRVNTNQVVTTDLLFTDAMVQINLGAPSRCSIKIPQPEQFRSAQNIEWKAWSYWLIPEIEIGQQRRFLGAQLLERVTVDPQSGELNLEGIGFLGYPKGIPWLENWNPIAVDVGEVFQKVWAHLQNYTNANLGVEVLPALLGIQMLPGYSFDGTTLNFDFFALFIRAIDFQDAGDFLAALARDIPVDMYEEVTLQPTGFRKVVRIGYPQLGYKQTAIEFIQGENVIMSEKAEDLDIEPVTDVIVRGWRPGSVYTSELTNSDGSMVRRVIMEEDANINSTERAAAWAKRRLTRRNIPKSFKKIVVDPNHPNAPIDNWWLADSVWVSAQNYPWYGTIEGWHRITSITFKANELPVEIGLKIEGAFNFDPIDYDPNWQENPTEDTNLLTNGYFSSSTAGWTRLSGQWFRVATEGYRENGCVRVDCDDGTEFLESHKVNVNPGGSYKFTAWVKRQEMEMQSGINSTVDGIFIAAKSFNNGALVDDKIRIAGLQSPEGTGAWTELTGWVTVPAEGINQLSIVLCVTGAVDGVTWWDDVRIDPL